MNDLFKKEEIFRIARKGIPELLLIHLQNTTSPCITQEDRDFYYYSSLIGRYGDLIADFYSNISNFSNPNKLEKIIGYLAKTLSDIDEFIEIVSEEGDTGSHNYGCINTLQRKRKRGLSSMIQEYKLAKNGNYTLTFYYKRKPIRIDNININ